MATSGSNQTPPTTTSATGLPGKIGDYLRMIIAGETGDGGLRRRSHDPDMQYPELTGSPMMAPAPLKAGQTVPDQVPVVDVISLEAALVSGTDTDVAIRFLFANHYPFGALATNAPECVTVASDPRYALLVQRCLELVNARFTDELAAATVQVDIEEMPFSDIDAALSGH